ncbi:MAG: tetratricopeptide repeat protein [Acidimicrobiales bacterium]
MSVQPSLKQLYVLADAGDRTAMGELGELLWSEQPEAARAWLERAADLGSWWAAGTLATLIGTSDESERWRHITSDLAQSDVDSGDVDAMTFLAWLHQDADPVQASALYLRAAEAGSLDAMERLGTLLVNRGNDREARQWYQRAAEAGSVNAMTNLGRLLFYTDREEGLKWLRKAAESGNIRAMKDLAAGIEFRDWDGAYTWIQKACDLGDEEACNLLAGAPRHRRLLTRMPLFAQAAEKNAMRRGREATRRMKNTNGLES